MRHLPSPRPASFPTQTACGPGPGSYTPREMLGVVDLTRSNTSTHAPSFSFGTSTRDDAPVPIHRREDQPAPSNAPPATMRVSQPNHKNRYHLYQPNARS